MNTLTQADIERFREKVESTPHDWRHWHSPLDNGFMWICHKCAFQVGPQEDEPEAGECKYPDLSHFKNGGEVRL